MQVTNPSAAHGSSQSSFRITNNNSSSSSCFIANDVLLFQFDYNDTDDATVEIELIDNQGNGFLGKGTLSWNAGTGKGIQFIEFSGFPLRADQVTAMDSCDAQITLINDSNSRTGINANVEIFLG